MCLSDIEHLEQYKKLIEKPSYFKPRMFKHKNQVDDEQRKAEVRKDIFDMHFKVFGGNSIKRKQEE